MPVSGLHLYVVPAQPGVSEEALTMGVGDSKPSGSTKKSKKTMLVTK